jgi:7-cyano-7-deazaguanine synthase
VKTALLISGGIDSIALAYWARPAIGITLDYGQLAARTESQAAAQVCRELGIEHIAPKIDCSQLGSGDLVGGSPLSVAPVSEWWPYRNQLLVTLAGAALLPHGVERILLGTVAGDAAHADGTRAFIEVLSALMQLQEGGMSVAAPAIDLSSVALVQVSEVPIELLSWAHSCHVSDFACGRCRGCLKHYTTMRDLGFKAY